MPNNESPSPAETPQSPEPQKPILLVNPVEIPDDRGEAPMSNDNDILELTEEANEEGARAENPSAKMEPSKSEAILKMIQEETQPNRPAVVRRTPTPAAFPKIEISTHEILRSKRKELDRKIFSIGGKVRDESSLKIIEGNMLAIMEISKETKDLKGLTEAFLQATSPNDSLPATGPMGSNGDTKVEATDNPLIFAQNFRNGIYLMLNRANGDLDILGGRQAEKLKPEILDEFYGQINTSDDFSILSRKIEKAGEARETQRGEADEEADHKSLASNS